MERIESRREKRRPGRPSPNDPRPLEREKTDVPICERCNEQHLTPSGYPACPAHISHGPEKGRPCRNEAGKGTGFLTGQCRKHGGNAPSSRKRAARIELEEIVKRQLGLTEWDPVTDPFSALADHAGKGKAVEEIMLAKVEELASLKQYGGDFGERIDVIFEAWERAYTRYGNVLTSMARLDLDDKIAKLQAKVDKETARQIEAALAAALSVVDLNDEQRQSILRVLGERLREPVAALAKG